MAKVIGGSLDFSWNGRQVFPRFLLSVNLMYTSIFKLIFELFFQLVFFSELIFLAAPNYIFSLAKFVYGKP